MRIVNLTHGSYYIFAAYVGVSVSKYTHNFWLALAAGIVTAALIGFLMERFLFRLLINQELEQILLTFGVIYIFQDICHWIWAGHVYTIDQPAFLSGPVVFLGMYFPSYRLALILIGLTAAVGLWFLQEKTLIGAIIRAGVDDREMVRALGIKISNFFTVVFVLGAGLAGLAGILGAPFAGVYPGLDMEILILALVVIVIGGLGSLSGALLSSLLIGLADAFGKAYFPDLAMFTIYGLMVVVLTLRPRGLLGKKE